MEKSKSNLIELFKSLSDPRNNSGKRHLLEDILTITVLGVLCGAEDWSAIEMYGKSQKDFLKTILKLPHGIPSDDTFRRLFIRIDHKEFETIFIEWTSQLPQILGVPMIHIDGKTLRHSFDRRDGTAALHLVSAWCSSNRMVLGQLKSEGKANEITTIPKLLKLINIEGAVITIDAMGCQKKIASKIIEQGANYILAVKENQKELYQQVIYAFDAQKAQDSNEQLEKGHGRIENRRCEVIDNLMWIDEKGKWRGLQSIIKIQSQREINGAISTEYRYYISSLKENAETFNVAIRQHWSIENNLHWVLDMAFREDDCRKRKGNESENFSIIRRFALNLLKKDPNKRLGIKNKRLNAAWDREYLISLFTI